MYLPYLNGSKHIDPNLTYAQFVDPIVKFGLFARDDLKVDTVIGEYTGVLTLVHNTEYTWSYPTNIVNNTNPYYILGIDSRKKGNLMRFVNAAPYENCNVVVRYIPYDNFWHILYITSSPVPKDMQLFVSYGDDYWSERNIILK